MTLAKRLFQRHIWLAVIAVFSLSSAMALAVLSLSVANTALLLPPSAPGADRLVTIYSRARQGEPEQISWPDYQYFLANNHVFTGIAAAPNSISLTIDSNFEHQVARVVSRPVSANYFEVMGIRPYLGGFFKPGDDQVDPHSAVMTYSCWKRLGADPHIVGKRLGSATIIGVTPAGFTGTFYGLNGDLLVPLSGDRDQSWMTKRDARRFFLTARLRPGVTKQQAQVAMRGMAGQLAAAWPKDDHGRTAVVTTATLLPPDMMNNALAATGILMALVMLILLIACANVGNLLLARAVGRRRQAAIKLALGATRGRLVREFLAEAALLCAISTALGFGAAAAVLARFNELTVEIPQYGTYSIGLNLRTDLTVLAMTLGLMLIAILATGLAPALYASAPNIGPLLTGEVWVGPPGKGVWRHALVFTEVAVCTLVLMGLGLCQRNLWNLRHADLGFSQRNLLSMTAYLGSDAIQPGRGKEMYQGFRKAVAALPGVESVGLARDLPLQGGLVVPVSLPEGGNKLQVTHTVVDGDYFGTLGIRLLKGRVFGAADTEKSPETVIVNLKMAELLWPGQDPLGKVIQMGDPARPATVVGVVADSKYEDIDEERKPFFYVALSRNYQEGVAVIARTAGNPGQWGDQFRKAIQSVGLDTPARPATFENWMNLSLFVERVSTGIVGGLSALGLLLAGIGLSGAVSWSVSRRTRELGIRVALGARTAQLAGMVLSQVARVAGAGIVTGLALGSAVNLFLRSQFYGLGAVEWVVMLPVGAFMLGIALGVAWLSARPWLAVDPMVAVRHN